MKRKFILGTTLLMICALGFSQAVSDRNVIPVAVNLNQVLRMTITNGGNIEFTFTTMDAYRNGISGAAGNASDNMYLTNFTVASSTRWVLNYGAETGTFIGTDDPTNTLALDNVGYSLANAGTHNFEAAAQGSDPDAELYSAPTVDGTEVAALQAYPVELIDDNGGTLANAGDITENNFTITWRCGTAEVGAGPATMNATSLLNQNPSPSPDRYVANVIFELGVAP